MRNRLSEPGTISILLLPVQFRRGDWILSAFFIGIVALYGAGVNDIILSNVRGEGYCRRSMGFQVQQGFQVQSGTISPKLKFWARFWLRIFQN